METIQVVVDKELLHAADRAARRMKANRSALVRDALREYLRCLEVRVREDRDREGYARQPQAQGDSQPWEAEAAWPKE
ncbi:MAG: ribbon-helix-helix domain-containing protein [Terracidiphilus sp.]|jgi:metal-responsive CopG/Arc/MetJ family transcriptional regulator